MDLSEFNVIAIDPGREVQCDFCGEDWTDRPESGGLMFGSKATCPNCEKRIMLSAAEYNELDYIKSKCPVEMSFANWVRNVLRK